MSTGLPNSRQGRPARLSAGAAGNSTALVGLELLKAIAKAGRLMPLTEIAGAAGMSASRTHRYLSSLRHAGFVRQDPDTGRYEIGPATIDIAVAAMKSLDGGQNTVDAMRELTHRTGLCSYLCVWGSNGPTVIRDEMGDVRTAARMRIGSNLSLLTATGKIFLAWLPEELTRDTLKRDVDDWNRESPGASATVEESLRQRGRVRKSGVAKTQGMRNPAWTAFSAPVFDRAGAFRMALTVIGVSSLFDTRLNGPVASQLKASAGRLSLSVMA